MFKIFVFYDTWGQNPPEHVMHWLSGPNWFTTLTFGTSILGFLKKRPKTQFENDYKISKGNFSYGLWQKQYLPSYAQDH